MREGQCGLLEKTRASSGGDGEEGTEARGRLRWLARVFFMYTGSCSEPDFIERRCSHSYRSLEPSQASRAGSTTHQPLFLQAYTLTQNLPFLQRTLRSRFNNSTTTLHFPTPSSLLLGQERLSNRRSSSRPLYPSHFIRFRKNQRQSFRYTSFHPHRTPLHFGRETCWSQSSRVWIGQDEGSTFGKGGTNVSCVLPVTRWCDEGREGAVGIVGRHHRLSSPRYFGLLSTSSWRTKLGRLDRIGRSSSSVQNSRVQTSSHLFHLSTPFGHSHPR